MPEASAEPSTGTTSDSPGTTEPTAAPTAEPTADGTPVPEVSIPPWDGKERLNILLVGADRQGGGYNTDTLITVSIDPVTKQVAMFSLPRDMINVPVPREARALWGSVYGQKINSFYINNRNRCEHLAREQDDPRLQRPEGDARRALRPRHPVLRRGRLRRASARSMNALGGVTVNVQIPIVDDTYPAGEGRDRRLYIPTGLQHMTGAEALRYARSRHTTNDFDRAARQQRVLLSMREQADPQELIPRLPELDQRAQESRQDRHPARPARRAARTRVRGRHGEHHVVRVPAAPLRERDATRGSGYKMFPNVSKIRSAVKNAFKTKPADEALREALAEEAASIWVLIGSSDGPRSRAGGLPRVPGLAASAPRAKPEGGVPASTKIVVYNGAEAELTETIAYLEKTFDVTATTVDDPAIRTDIVVTIGSRHAEAHGSAAVLTRAAARARRPGPAPYSTGVSQCAYSGRRPRTASK